MISAFGIDHGTVAKGLTSDKPKVARRGLQPVYSVTRDAGKPTQTNYIAPGTKVTAHDTGKRTLFRRRPKLALTATGKPKGFSEKKDRIDGTFAIKTKFTTDATRRAVREYKNRTGS